jgi:hypothetical protein
MRLRWWDRELCDNAVSGSLEVSGRSRQTCRRTGILSMALPRSGVSAMCSLDSDLHREVTGLIQEWTFLAS